MTQITHLSRTNHNVATNNFDKHYVSYNWADRDIYGSDTTAIVIGQMQRFYILDGNHFEKLKALSFEDCMNYFQENINLKNKFSNAYTKEDAVDVIQKYEEFKNNPKNHVKEI